MAVQIGSVSLPDFPLLLAPMEDVSDPPFRILCKKYGADLMFTEFISSEGLIRDASKSVQKLDIYEEERPIGIQIFGAELTSMQRSAEIVEAAKPDILDINFGCPVKKVVCKDAGAGILRDIPRMVRLTEAIVKSTSLPVTVKTRLGWDDHSIKIEEVAERLQDVGIQALSIHGRTRKQMYKGSANWEWIAKVKENPRVQIPIFGNGDVDTPQRAAEVRDKYGVDGIMIGRASIGSPWVFRAMRAYLDDGSLIDPPTMDERIDTCLAHLKFSLDWKGPVLGVVEMRRHYTNYFKGYANIKPWRTKLVTTNEPDAVIATLEAMRHADIEKLSQVA